METDAARLDMYSYMAHFVGEKLHIRPGEILDEWCAAELVVTFGVYMNEISQQRYAEWKSLSTNEKSIIPAPKEYIVRFIEA